MFEDTQIDRLANFIMHTIPGEPSKNEGAVDCAIRLLRGYRAALKDIKATLHIDGTLGALGAVKAFNISKNALESKFPFMFSEDGCNPNARARTDV